MKIVGTRTGNTGASFTEGIQRWKRVSPALKTAQKQWKPHRNYIRRPQMVTRKLHIHTLLRRKQLYKAQTVAEQTLRKMLEISIYLNYSLFVLFRKEKKSRNQILGTSIKNWSTTVSPFFFPESQDDHHGRYILEGLPFTVHKGKFVRALTYIIL